MEFIKKYFFKSNQPPEPNYRCVNCGNPMRELFKTYSPTIQKLVECDQCNKIADELIEFENLVIIIDLILLSTEAQRHVLYNTNCKNLYKILMIITLLESYFLWNEIIDNRHNFLHGNDPLYLEKGFYLSTLQIILCK
jgi:DNA-directed RNA polymerase subunit RPC12/RpoP